MHPQDSRSHFCPLSSATGIKKRKEGKLRWRVKKKGTLQRKWEQVLTPCTGAQNISDSKRWSKFFAFWGCSSRPCTPIPVGAPARAAVPVPGWQEGQVSSSAAGPGTDQLLLSRHGVGEWRAPWLSPSVSSAKWGDRFSLTGCWEAWRVSIHVKCWERACYVVKHAHVSNCC